MATMATSTHQITESKPVPDPTIATNEAVERANISLRDHIQGQIEMVEARLSGMDRAVDLRVTTVSTLVATVESHIESNEKLNIQRFTGVSQQLDLVERQRVEQKTDTKVAVDAALSAQKEAVKEQTLASATAIAKSEASTSEQLKQLGVNFATAIAGLTTTINDMKDRIVKIESFSLGSRDQRSEARAQGNYLNALVGTVLAAAGIAIGYIIKK